MPSIGRDAGLADDRLSAAMVLMALATTFATGPAVDRLRRSGLGDGPSSRPLVVRLEGHVDLLEALRALGFGLGGVGALVALGQVDGVGERG